MFYYDIHTHRIPQERENVVSIVNLPSKADKIPHTSNTFFSRGILPGEILDIFDEKEYFRIREQLHDPRVVAVGECGIDHRITATSIGEQIRTFERMIFLSTKNTARHSLGLSTDSGETSKRHNSCNGSVSGFR